MPILGANSRTWGNVAVFGAAAALVLYLGLSRGGYDLLVWAELGVAAWCGLLLAAVIGLVRLRELERTSLVALAAFTGLAVWAALGLIWADSAERGVIELARLVTYLGLFTAALLAARAGQGRALVGGVAAALAVVGGVALLSRLHPAWFPLDPGAPPITEPRRLQYPLNYFNGVAALLAIAIPLLGGLAVAARSVVARGVCAAAVPALALALYFTLSRGGFLALGVGLLVLLLLIADRVPKLVTLLVPGAGSALLIAAAGRRDALHEGLRDATARDQGDEMLLLTVLVCVAVGLLAIAVSGLAERLPTGWQPRRRPAAGLAAGVALVGSVVFLAAGGAGAVSDGWEDFRKPAIEANLNTQTTRLTSFSGRGRYQLWRSALDAAEQAPVHGIGTGGFEYWWAEHGRLKRFVRNAHSLYLETLGELGIVGLALLLAFVASVLVGGALRALRGFDRSFQSVCVAGCAAFALSAGVDWVWQIPVLPAAFLIVGAVAVAGRPLPPPSVLARPSWAARLPVALVALAALAALLPALLGTSAVRSSELAAADGRLGDALADARTGERVQPYASSPKLQRALVEERGGRFARAAAAAREATRADPHNWRAWLVRSRVEARAGHPRAAVSAYRRARALNPRSLLFQQRP